MSTERNETITAAVQARYGAIARQVLGEQDSSARTSTTVPTSCCSPASTASCCSPAASGCCGAGEEIQNGDRISQGIYMAGELEGVPLQATLASLGCGNPTALAELRSGEVTLDLGSGGGIDVLLSARRVGPSGFAYGLDMTDAMLELAQRNAAESGVKNVAFLKGDIAAIPLPDNSVDVIISNCVINLAADKAPVLREAFRVLKPGGRFAVSDIVIMGGLAEGMESADLRRDLSSWADCIAGALTDAEYRSGLVEAGFTDIHLEVTRRFSIADLGSPLPDWAVRLGESLAVEIAGRFTSAFVRARKSEASGK